MKGGVYMKGHEIIKKLTSEEMPNFEKVREICHMKGEAVVPAMRLKRFVPVVVVMVMLLAVSTTAFAALGGFDWFVERFNPTFADVVEPVMAYSEDQGIRLTVIGARRFDNAAIVYLSLQDISGENRLTESVGFGDGFSVGMEAGGRDILSFGTRRELLYFDEATNTAYFEIIIDTDTLISDPLTISSFLIVFEETFYEYEPIHISLADITSAEMLPIAREHKSGWTSWRAEITDDFPFAYEILRPSRLTVMPHADDYWISALGVANGRIHIQAIQETSEFGASGVTFFLVSPSGDITYPTVALHAWLDEELSPVNLGEYLNLNGQLPSYQLRETIFITDTNTDYTLVFTGRVRSGIEGNWKVFAYSRE
jgi:hypothetical protein